MEGHGRSCKRTPRRKPCSPRQELHGASPSPHHPPADARAVARAGGPVRQTRCVERLLVHVLAHRQRLPGATQGGEPGGPPLHRPARTAARPARVRRRHGRGLVPGDPAPRASVSRWIDEVRAARLSAGLVGVLLLRPAGIPGARRQRGAARGGHPLRAQSRCAGGRGLSLEDRSEVVHRSRLDLRPRWIPQSRRSSRGPPDHAPGVAAGASCLSEHGGSAPHGPTRATMRTASRSYLLYRLNSSTAFVPPNPKLLLITASTRTSRGLFGT